MQKDIGNGKGRKGGIPLQPALPWRRLGRGLLHRAPSTEPQPIYPEASEKRHRLHNRTLLFTLLDLGRPQQNLVTLLINVLDVLIIYLYFNEVLLSVRIQLFVVNKVSIC